MSDRAATPGSKHAARPARQTGGGAAEPRPLIGLQLEGWRLLWQQLLRDGDALAECRVWEERRRRAAPEMLALLRRFLDADVGVEGLRAAVDRGTRAEWEAFGLRGASGAMFLNRLARHAAHHPRTESLLREVLALPRDPDDAGGRLSAFMEALSGAGAVDAGGAPSLQPARAVFFASVWWHVQDTERWPVFQPSARRALREEQDVFVPGGSPPADYVAFREAFVAVATGLHTSAWELEYLCWWRQQRGTSEEAPELFYEPGASRARLAAVREPRPSRRRSLDAPAPLEPASVREARPPRPALHHTEVQWVLARIGKKLGCRVWVAANDHAKSWQGRPLGELSVRRLPSLGLSAASQAVVSLIDVVWLRGANEVVAAFEIEHTTSVYSGLLRLADLAALSPNLRFPLYIVAPRLRLDKVRRELSRPSLRALGLHERCAFLPAEALLDAADNIVRWATDPSALDRLATRAEDLQAHRRAD